jgi:molybdopterin-containing oxidoreductase family membrane subunit
MLEKALQGKNTYWGWILFLIGVMIIGAICYVRQYIYGLGLTGMSRDVSWGFYIAQFTFFVGVAAGGVMLVLPYYVHDFKAFGKITILGEFMAIAAICMCLMFIIVDLGQPQRALNVLLHPTPHSMLFWDMIVLNVYLLLNIVIGWVVLHSQFKNAPAPKWIKAFIWISIPWAISIHTVTAMLYCGLPGRHFWLTAILAPRFLASAFAAGPALLLIVSLIMKKVANFDAGDKAIQKLTTIIAYAAIFNFFFVGLEFFVAYYSNLPGHMHTLDYLFFGLDGHDNLVSAMRFSTFIGIAATIMFLIPKCKQNTTLLPIMCVMIFVSLLIDKGIGFVLGGFVPSPLDYITEYVPTMNELAIVASIWAAGAFILTILYRIVIAVKNEEA